MLQWRIDLKLRCGAEGFLGEARLTLLGWGLREYLSAPEFT